MLHAAVRWLIVGDLNRSAGVSAPLHHAYRPTNNPPAPRCQSRRLECARAGRLKRSGEFAITAAAFMLATTLFTKAQIVADDSFVEISQPDLSLILKMVSATFDRPDSVLFAELRSVNRGYCGFVNATLEYEGYFPFFFEPATGRVELGIKGRLPDTQEGLPDASEIKEPEACH
jgi:hypothetical protein